MAFGQYDCPTFASSSGSKHDAPLAMNTQNRRLATPLEVGLHEQGFLRIHTLNTGKQGKEGGGGMYEVVVLHGRHDVQRLELREQLIRRRRVDNEYREPSNRRRRPCEHLKRAVSVLREERERYSLHGVHRDYFGGKKIAARGGVSREYPRERTVSVLMDGHLHAQREQHPLSDVIEALIDKGQGMEVKRLGKKQQYVIYKL
ncbi:hypothetical protein BJY52DRAFT_1224532 [Lactarius psammicola]|nr:hypothetical protein BJY52DRAFT_1224532 [Lactarius psammicola]